MTRFFIRFFFAFYYLDVYSAMDIFFCNKLTKIFVESFITYQEYCLWFSDFLYLLLLFIVIIYRLCASGPQIERLGTLIWIIISGLFIQIFMLIYSLSLFKTFSFFNEHFLYSPFIIFLKIFICIIAICIFFSMLDYFQYENFISYELVLLFYYV